MNLLQMYFFHDCSKLFLLQVSDNLHTCIYGNGCIEVCSSSYVKAQLKLKAHMQVTFVRFAALSKYMQYLNQSISLDKKHACHARMYLDQYAHYHVCIHYMYACCWLWKF